LSRDTKSIKRTVSTQVENGILKYTASESKSLGTTRGRYQSPVDGDKRLYKGGYFNLNDVAACFRRGHRNTLIYITNMQGVNVTVPTSIITENSRIL
jgi:hypothetical protein